MTETVEERTKRVAEIAKDIARGETVPGANSFDVNGRVNLADLVAEVRAVPPKRSWPCQIVAKLFRQS